MVFAPDDPPADRSPATRRKAERSLERGGGAVQLSLDAGIPFGMVVAGAFAFLVACMDGRGYWWQMMLPGSVLGIIVGYATQKHGTRPRADLKLDGPFGFRVGQGLNLHVVRLDYTTKLAPARGQD